MQPPKSDAPKLADLGISKDQSSRWQKIAAVPEDAFEGYSGGPLDGRPAARHKGRFGVWRTEDGRHVPTTEGDSRFLGHDHGAGPAFYVCLDGDGRYVHSSTLGRKAAR